MGEWWERLYDKGWEEEGSVGGGRVGWKGYISYD